VKETGGADKVYAVSAHETYACNILAGGLLSRLRGYFKEYLESYERGCRKYGVWWVVFTGAMLFAVLVLITFAFGLYFFILPRLPGA
jgi:hypothetical protein